jgi:hypothetical protein
MPRNHARDLIVAELRPVTGAAVLLTLVVSTYGCGLPLGSASPTNPSSGTTETFSGSLGQRDTKLYTFTVSQAGTVTITLTSLGPAPVAVGLGIGTPNGTTSCTLISAIPSATAGTTPQLTVTENPGSYCVDIYDAGNLTGASTFSITIVHP